MPEIKAPLLVLTGPTACGKSSIAVSLAEKLSTEIISGDSVQVYKHFDIGTAKPDKDLTDRARHHLIDVVEPHEEYNVSRFREEAGKIARALWSAKKIPLVAGGTGLYLKALIEGFHCGVKTSAPVRDELSALYKKVGQKGAYEMAMEIDPEWMSKVHPNDTFRTQRAVGVYMTSGKTMTELFRNNQSSGEWDALIIVIDLPRKTLYDRIEARVEAMLSNGWKDEITRLKKMGYNRDTKPMRSLGYSELYEESEGIISADETMRLIKKSTKAFARRQLTWLRKVEGAVFIPVKPDSSPDSVAGSILSLDVTKEFLARHGVQPV